MIINHHVADPQDEWWPPDVLLAWSMAITDGQVDEAQPRTNRAPIRSRRPSANAHPMSPSTRRLSGFATARMLAVTAVGHQHATVLWIGMPVYNSARTITKAMDSLLSQSCGDFILFISDNASTDGTSDLLRTYAARDPRIRYVRQPFNRGAFWNFAAVIAPADTPYFMWAAADDWWGPDFVRDNLEQLRQDPRAVLSVSRTTFVERDGSLRPSDDTSPLTGTPANNIAKYLTHPLANSRFYGIHRLGPLKRAFRVGIGAFLATDWAIMVHTLRYGNHRQVDQIQFFRHVGGASTDRRRLLGLFRHNPLDFFFPMARFTLSSLRVGPQNFSFRLFLVLARYNGEYAIHRFLPGVVWTPKSIKRAIHRLLGLAAQRLG